jgi:hypothetical protein
MQTHEEQLKQHIEELEADCRKFLDIADFAQADKSEHLLKLSIIGHNFCKTFEHFEYERIKERLENGRA